MTKKRYHHGNLRAALVAAGEEVLVETGVEGFSLRRVARKAGVSHSAPAHHFDDSAGLLTAMAAEGFRRLLIAMKARQAAAPDDPREKFYASTLGYLDFARDAPALFRLMFVSDRTREATPELAAATDAVFVHLAADMERLRGVPPVADADALAELMAGWGMVHGYAELVISGRVSPLTQMNDAALEVFFRRVFMRTTS